MCPVGVAGMVNIVHLSVQQGFKSHQVSATEAPSAKPQTCGNGCIHVSVTEPRETQQICLIFKQASIITRWEMRDNRGLVVPTTGKL